MSKAPWQYGCMENIKESQNQTPATGGQCENNATDGLPNRERWLRGLAEEFVKLELSLPGINFLPDKGCPAWVEKLECEVGSAMFSTAKLKEGYELTPRRFGAILGHQCAVAVWMMEWLDQELENPQVIDETKFTPEQFEQGAIFLRKLTEEWYPALRELARKALASSVDQTHGDMSEFLLAYSTAFARKPSDYRWDSFGNSAFAIYNFMLMYWRLVNRLESVRHLHEVLVKVFGPYRTGDLKRTEKICQRIGLSYRKPGRPSKIIQTPAA